MSISCLDAATLCLNRPQILAKVSYIVGNKATFAFKVVGIFKAMFHFNLFIGENEVKPKR